MKVYSLLGIGGQKLIKSIGNCEILGKISRILEKKLCRCFHGYFLKEIENEVDDCKLSNVPWLDRLV